jgi:hypothetical protein
MSNPVHSPSPPSWSAASRWRSAIVGLAALGLLPGALQAGPENPPAPADPLPLADSALRIGGILDTSLPGTERRNALRFVFHPHFGDLVHRDFLRIPLGLRYGVTSRWELNGETTAYFAHGLRGSAFGERVGVSDLRLGTKFNLGETPFAEWETALGVDFVRPVGGPPPEITDGLLHLAPYVTFSRHLPTYPSVRVFWSLGVDLVARSSVEGELLENQLADDANLFTGGVVWKRGPLNLTLEINYGTTRLLGVSDRDVFTVRPGVVWELPPRWAPVGRGQWLVGAGLRATSGPDGEELGASIKIRVDANLRNLLSQRITGQNAESRRSKPGKADD